MNLNCTKMSINSDELGSQVVFYDSNKSDKIYLLIQRYYGDFEDEGNSCYIESSYEDFCGHFKKLDISLSKNKIEIDNESKKICINLEIVEDKIQKLNKVLKIIVGGIPMIKYYYEEI